MLAVVEADAGREAKGEKADAGQEAKGEKAADEGPRTPPPPAQPQPREVARPPRQPTPDHPPYCWMIGEAIDLLAEDGGSAEDDILACIGARHPGVPRAHDRLLRHYLGKHVAEGVFVRTAAGRYQRRTEENAAEAMLLQVEQQAEAGLSRKPASVEVEAKRGRGRGRPRRDGSPSTPPLRKDGRAGAQWMMTQSGGSSSTLAAAAKDSAPMSLVAVADKDGSQTPSLKPKRRRHRLRKLGMASSGDSALVAGKKHGSEVPYTLDKEHEPPRELGLVIFGDSSATSTMEKACTEVPPTVPLVDGGGQPLDLALVTTTEVPMPEPAPTPAMDKDGGDASSIVDKNDSICTTPTAPEPGSQACELALMAAEVPPSKTLVDGAQPLDLALVSTTEVPVPEPAPTPTPAMDKDGDQPLDLAQVTTTEVPVPEPVSTPSPTPAMDKDGSQPLHPVTTTEVSEPVPPTPAMDKDGGQPLDLAQLNTAEVPVSEPAPTPTPTPAMNKDGGVDKNESICITPTVPEPGSQACKLALMAAAAAGFVPVLVANKKGGLKGSPSATYKDVLQPRKAGSAPTPGKKAGGKALSVSALLEGRRRQHKSAEVTTGDRSALTPGKKLSKLSFASPKSTPVIAGGCPTPASVADQGGMEASAALKQHGRPHKLYPVTADEISDDPGTVLLALPSQALAASNTQLQTWVPQASHMPNTFRIAKRNAQEL